MHRTSRAPVLSATLHRVSCWITCALSTTSTRRQRFVLESGRVSVMRTRSPTCAVVLLVVRGELGRAPHDLPVQRDGGSASRCGPRWSCPWRRRRRSRCEPSAVRAAVPRSPPRSGSCRLLVLVDLVLTALMDRLGARAARIRRTRTRTRPAAVPFSSPLAIAARRSSSDLRSAAATSSSSSSSRCRSRSTVSTRAASWRTCLIRIGLSSCPVATWKRRLNSSSFSPSSWDSSSSSGSSRSSTAFIRPPPFA